MPTSRATARREGAGGGMIRGASKAANSLSQILRGAAGCVTGRSFDGRVVGGLEELRLDAALGGQRAARLLFGRLERLLPVGVFAEGGERLPGRVLALVGEDVDEGVVS